MFGLYKGDILLFDFVMYWEFIFIFDVFSVVSSFFKLLGFIYFLDLGFFDELFDRSSEEEGVLWKGREEVIIDLFVDEFDFNLFENE